MSMQEGRAISLQRLGVSLVFSPLLFTPLGCGGVDTSQDGPPSIPSVAPPGYVPTPVAVGASFQGSCSLVWLNANGNGTFDFYEIDLSGSVWQDGTQTFGPIAVGYYVIGYYPERFSFESAGMATSGSFSLEVSGSGMGAKADLLDLGFQRYFDATGLFSGTSVALGGLSASGGAGSFEGVLSDPDRAAPVSPGLGTIDMDFGGFSGAFGGSGSGVVDYAFCVPTAAAP